MVLKNDYIELINPLLADIYYDGRKVTWERYFIHKSELSSVKKNLFKK